MFCEVEKVTANVVPVIRRRVWIADFFFALMVLPGTDGRVDKTAKKKIKLMSSTIRVMRLLNRCVFAYWLPDSQKVP